MPKIEHLLKYTWNAELYTAVNVAAAIADRFKEDGDRDALKNSLIEFFCTYDENRTMRIDILTTKLKRELMRSEQFRILVRDKHKNDI